ncbi:MAG: hypothetical protein II777_10300 [Clostridia bacterium]|nr:hypothetical protein [Clostridia bacterium]
MKKSVKIIIVCVISVMVLCASAITVAYASGSFNKIDKDRVETWYDDNPDSKLSVEDTKKVAKGMTFAEVVELIGKPQRDVGSGAYVPAWDLDNGDTFIVTFNPMVGSKSLGDLEVYTFSIESGRYGYGYTPVTEEPVTEPAVN